MSTITNFFREGRHYRSIYREGRFFLATEAQELQLEALEAVRNEIRSVFGVNASVADAFKVEVDPSNSQAVIMRPGKAFIDGYPVALASGTDYLYNLGKSPANFDSSDFIKSPRTISDVGGITLNFGGATIVAGNTYAIVIEIKEELITPTQDPMLKSANLSEDTAEKHRIAYDVHIVLASALDNSPVPYTGSGVDNVVNSVDITKSGVLYSLVSSTVITGSEQIDGRNLECIFDNGNGSSTAAFPVSNDDLKEYIHGSLIDSNGIEFHITYIQVTPGNSNRITMTLDLAKTRPVAAGTFQANPVITDSLPYKIVKKDLMYTTTSNLPEGKRYFQVATVTWDGSSFVPANIIDNRPQVLAYDAVLALIQQNGMNLFSESIFTWDKDQNSGKLVWDNPIKIHSMLDLFEWTIPAGNTFSLFGSALANNEVLYVNLDDAPIGGSIVLKKGIRGTGELTAEFIRSYKIYWVCKRLSDNRLYFTNSRIYNDKQSKPFFDVPPERLLPQDILSLGYNAMFDDDLYDASAIDSATSTGLYFASSYIMEYSNRTIAVAGNIVTLDSNASYTLQIGDVVVQGLIVQPVTAVNAQNQVVVANGAVLSNGAATIAQKMTTKNLRTVDVALDDQIASYYSDSIGNVLITYDDGEVQSAGNLVRIGYTATADGSAYTAKEVRPEALSAFHNKVTVPTAGLDVRLKFFPVLTTGDGSVALDAFRAFMHDRLFVGTLIPASGGGGGGSGTSIDAPAVVNTSGSTLNQFRAVAITPSGLNYSDSSSPIIAQATLGVLRATVLNGAASDIAAFGLVSGALSAYAFTSGDEVYLDVNGQFATYAQAVLFPSGYAIKKVGFAINSADLWVAVEPGDIVP